MTERLDTLARIPEGAPVDGAAGWRVTGAVMACLAVGPSALLVACFGVIAGPLGREFGWARDQIGFAVSLMAVGIMIAAPLQGLLIDRFGVRRVVLISIPLFAVGLASLRFIPPDLTVFYVVWGALPFLAIGVWPVSYLKAVSTWFDRNLGLATGFANAGIGIGTIVLPTLLALVIAALGVRSGFLAMSGLALSAWLPAWLGVRERVQGLEARGGAARSWSYGRILRDPTYLKILAAFFLFGVTGTGLLANLVPILMSKGLTSSAAVSAMAAFGVSALIGRLLTGWLLDRFHAARVVFVLGATTVGALALLAFPSPAWAPLTAAVLIGLLSGGEFDVLAYVLRRYFGLDSFGKMYGTAFSGFQLGAAAGAAALAISIGRTGSYGSGLIVLAACVSLGVLVVLSLKPYPARDHALEAGPAPLRHDA